MSFARVPKESKKQINKAGRALAKANLSSFDLNEIETALSLINKWRACHAYPINTFKSTLRQKSSEINRGSIVAQRLKRMPTIIDKLKRYPSMQVTTMQDIAGLRSVLGTVKEVYALANKYKRNKNLPHQFIKEKDYIKEPRSEDGYRSLHLIYKYVNKKQAEYNGLYVEIQIRTKLQHIWATAVETMGTFLGQALKSRQGDKDWLDFFSVVSSAFTFMEKSNIVPCHKGLSKEEIYLRVYKIEKKLKALEKMRGFSTAVELIKNKTNKNENMFKSSFYHLIILNSIKKTLQIKAYNRNSLDKAMEDYAKVEERAIKGEKIEPVLVSAGSLKMLRRAYPNFFLDIGEFMSKISGIISYVELKGVF